jgi:hypothetical protein
VADEVQGDDLIGGALREVRRAGPEVRLLVAEMERAGGGSGAAGGFLVDPERAQACIDALGEILADIRDSLLYWQQTAFAPPGEDAVSVNVAHRAALMSSRAEGYVQAWMAQIEETRDALQRQFSAYQVADESWRA